MASNDGNLLTRMKNRSGRYHSHEFKGAIIPAHGGYIVRSTGRKDRHSKVVTAKGVRDRRVRLSAHTAIQFYDVQDRLGYDRPSKAIDWLMQHAKGAIDQLTHLPRDTIQPNHSIRFNANSASNDGNDLPTSTEVENYRFNECTNASASVAPSSSSTFQNCMSQDLRLSLQPLKEDTWIVRHQHHQIAQNSVQQTMFAAETIPAASSNTGGAEFFNNVALQTQAGQLRHRFYSQREPLQSSYMTPFKGWVNSLASTDTALIPITRNLVTADGYGGISGFIIPERFQGEEDGLPESTSRH